MAVAKRPSEAALKAIGRRIRTAIENAGTTQAQLCRDLGVAPNTMSRYLNGSMSPVARLFEMGRVLGVSEAWLRGDEGAELDPVQRTIEEFVVEDGPRLRPPLSTAEARYLRSWPHRAVTRGRLLDTVIAARSALTSEQVAESAEVTDEARSRGAALGVPSRKPR